MMLLPHLLIAWSATDALPALPTFPNTPAMQDALPRKPLLGLQFETGTLLVRGTVPGGSAEGNFQPGDEVQKVDGVAVTNVAQISAAVAAKSVGAKMTFTLKRGTETIDKVVELKERPREVSPDYDVMYSHVLSNGKRIRTIITKPKKAGKFPVFMMIQGLGQFSMDFPLSGSGPYDVFLRNFAKQDFVTLRVEKPGMGDAEGGPYPETDFVTEADVYLQAIRAIKKEAYADPDRVFVFGHSMGGTLGPYVLSQEKVRGFISASTLYKTWVEYWLENLRRQMILGGSTPVEVHNMLRAQAVIQPLIFAENWDPKKVSETFPQYKSYVDAEYAQEGKWQGRTLAFWRQLAQLNYADLWKKTDTDVLSMWGQYDFVSTEEDQKMIADFREPKGTYRRIDNANHGFSTVSSYADAFAKLTTPTPPNMEAVTVIDAWIKERLK